MCRVNSSFVLKTFWHVGHVNFLGFGYPIGGGEGGCSGGVTLSLSGFSGTSCFFSYGNSGSVKFSHQPRNGVIVFLSICGCPSRHYKPHVPDSRGL